VSGIEGLQEAMDDVRHLGESAGVDGVAAETLGEGNDAVGQRDRTEDARPVAGAFVGDPAHLGRSAADVEQQHPRERRVQERRAAVQRQPRLRVRRDRLQRQPGFGLDAGEERRAVGGAAAGLGGDAADVSDPGAAEPPGADLQCIDRAADGGLGKPAAGAQALAEPDDAGKRADHPEAPARGRFGDQHAAVVGAEIDGAVGRGLRWSAAGRTRPFLPVFVRRRLPGSPGRGGW